MVNLDISHNTLDGNDAVVASEAFQDLPTLIELGVL